MQHVVETRDAGGDPQIVVESVVILVGVVAGQKVGRQVSITQILSRQTEQLHHTEQLSRHTEQLSIN